MSVVTFSQFDSIFLHLYWVTYSHFLQDALWHLPIKQMKQGTKVNQLEKYVTVNKLLYKFITTSTQKI